MKTTLLPPCLRLFLVVSLAALTHATLRASDDRTTNTVKLSAPDKPATLRINLPWADLHITGVDGDTITVESTVAAQESKDSLNAGLRRLDDESNFTLSEHDNIVSLTLAGENPAAGGHNAAFKISLPRAMALDVKTELGGDLNIKDVSGDIEINNTNGDVQLHGIVGSAIINTMNGEVHASYVQAPQKLISLTSMNGEIDLQVPADTKANVQLRTQNGSILTDFDKAKLRTKSASKSDSDKAQVHAAAQTMPSPDVPTAPRPPLPPIIGGKAITGTLNGGGGVDIKVSTMNGKIMLRQTKSSTTGSAINTGTKDNITVSFQDPDNFTDVAEDFPSSASEYYLDELRDCVQKEAALRLPAGSKLSVTFTDIDLAGMIRPDRNNVRFMTSTTIPRAQLKFQLIGADGQVLQEGERKLSDMNCQMSIGIMGRNDPLYYDKELLKDWIAKEFKPRS